MNGKNNIEFIQNKMEKRRVKIYKRENEEESVTVKLRVVEREREREREREEILKEV